MNQPVKRTFSRRFLRVDPRVKVQKIVWYIQKCLGSELRIFGIYDIM